MATSRAQALGEALKMVDGDASNKDKLAEAMTKVKFNAPRGPFRMDPVTHNPIQDIYICQVIERDGKITTKILATLKDVAGSGQEDLLIRSGCRRTSCTKRPR